MVMRLGGEKLKEERTKGGTREKEVSDGSGEVEKEGKGSCRSENPADSSQVQHSQRGNLQERNQGSRQERYDSVQVELKSSSTFFSLDVPSQRKGGKKTQTGNVPESLRSRRRQGGARGSEDVRRARQ